MYQRTSVNGMKLVLGDLNSRIYSGFPGEEDIIGEYCFGRHLDKTELGTNRDLLLEFCETYALAVSNTFCPGPTQHRATFRNIGVGRQAVIDATTHAQLDLVLAAQSSLDKISNVRSHPLEPLASHHFAVTVEVEGSVPKQEKCPKEYYDRAALKDPIVLKNFTETFEKLLESDSGELKTQFTGDVNVVSDHTLSCFRRAERQCLPLVVTTRRKPWISEETILLIEQRRLARLDGNLESEIFLHRAVRKSVRHDKRLWLTRLAGRGKWLNWNLLSADRIFSQARAPEVFEWRARGFKRQGRCFH